MSITVIGEANIDITVKPHGVAHPSGCTPSEIQCYHGGVARNIAHNLKLLGHDVKLVSVFGDDDFAHDLIDECQALGIDISLSSRYKNAKSPLFLSFNDEIGNMCSSYSDIGINNYLNLDWLRERVDAINRSDLVVADTLLTADALAFLMDYCIVPLYIDTVSPKRAMYLSEALKKSWKKSIFALKCSLAEAQAITGVSEANKAVEILVSKGIKNVYLTLGEDGVCFCSGKETRHYPAISIEAVNVTGSGDAFFAGVIHANTKGLKCVEAVEYGIKAACNNVKSGAPVNPTLRPSLFDE